MINMSELEFVTKHRRHLHQYPELSLHEFETTTYIKEFLDKLGVEYDCPLETGAIAYLEGQSNHTLSLIHISEPTRPLYISYAVFCLKKKK